MFDKSESALNPAPPLLTPKSRPKIVKSEEGWLIENGKSEVVKPDYLIAQTASYQSGVRHPPAIRWTTDANAALRLRSKPDAEALAELLCGLNHGHRIREHGFDTLGD